jgi:hypothetical protein
MRGTESQVKDQAVFQGRRHSPSDEGGFWVYSISLVGQEIRLARVQNLLGAPDYRFQNLFQRAGRQLLFRGNQPTWWEPVKKL